MDVENVRLGKPRELSAYLLPPYELLNALPLGIQRYRWARSLLDRRDQLIPLFRIGPLTLVPDDKARRPQGCPFIL
ncbi:hypothetical protein D3C81_1992990 [compost metagenome]